MRHEKEERGRKRDGDRRPGADERGFAMVLVLAALLMLAVLGATSLLLMVSTLKGVEGNKPEDRAFQIAKAGLNVAHAKIVANEVGPEGYGDAGDIMGGRYEFFVEALGGYDYRITSSGEYVEDGTPYRRKIQETAMYSAERSFDAIRNYMCYAGRDLTINVGEDSTNLNEIKFTGSLRAERDLLINVAPWVKIPDGLTVNGSVEGKNSVTVIAKPGGTGGGQAAAAYIFGNIRSGDIRTGSPSGSVTLRTLGEKKAVGTIKAATGGGLGWEITSTSFSATSTGPNDVLEYGPRKSEPGMEKVFIPEPDLAYYKVLAMDQKNYFIGDKTLSGDLTAMGGGTSSLTVVYCTGNMTLQNVNWNNPKMRGIFVCEGNFTTNTTSSLKFEQQSIFQVIAMKNITFKNDWQFPKGGATSEFFFWAGNDAYIDLAMFAQQLLQVTAVRDIYIESKKAPSHKTPCEVFYRGPDIDIAAWPIDIKVYDWKELPSHESD